MNVAGILPWFKKGREKMRTLPIVVALVVIAAAGICGGNEGAVTPTNKVVIGVLDFETSGPLVFGSLEYKKALMKELKQNTRVKLVDIGESCSLSDLKTQGYEQAEQYKMNYQLDMILHVYLVEYGIGSAYRGFRSHLSLIDLYRKKVKEVSIDAEEIPIELGFRGGSKKLLVSGDLNRLLRAKKKALAKKEMAVTREVKEKATEIEGKKEVVGEKEVTVPREVTKSPEEIEVFLIHNGPKLIAEGEYNQVLELIEDLPGRRRRHVQVQTLECFANLKGWVCDRDKGCKLSWWNLRQKLINSGDNEATPMLVILLKDEDPYLRVYAAELLGHIGDERALKDLRAVGEGDENHKVRKYAKRAYEQISGEEF